MKFILAALILDLLIGPPVFAADTLPWEAFVRGKQVYVWSEPGWTVMDCQSSLTVKADEKVQVLHQMRFELAQKACEQLKPSLLLKDRQAIAIETEVKRDAEYPNGVGPVFRDATILHGDLEETMRFYKTQITYRNDQGELIEFQGWVEGNLITTPSEKEFPVPELTTTTGRNQTQGKSAMANEATVASAILQIQKKTGDEPLTIKSDAELNRFVCLHRGDKRGADAKEQKSDEDDFYKTRFPDSVTFALQAESAFGIPRAFLRCTMLAESSYKRSQTSPAGAKGYAQVMPDTIDFLEKIGKDPKLPYGAMWKVYHAMNKKAVLNDRAVRHSDNMASAMGAMALYYRFMFDTEVLKNLASCSDCSGDLQKLKRKDIYLMAAGYNAGHGFIADMVRKTPASIRSSFPPPPESRDYVQKIERCMGSGWETTFVENKSNVASSNGRRKQNIRDLELRLDYQRRAYESKLKAHLSDTAKSEARKALIEEVRAGRKKGPMPKPLNVRPKPTEPDFTLQQEQIAHLKAMIAIDASESYSRRIKACNARFTNVEK
jgi:hypothetical protein